MTKGYATKDALGFVQDQKGDSVINIVNKNFLVTKKSKSLDQLEILDFVILSIFRILSNLTRFLIRN